MSTTAKEIVMIAHQREVAATMRADALAAAVEKTLEQWCASDQDLDEWIYLRDALAAYRETNS